MTELRDVIRSNSEASQQLDGVVDVLMGLGPRWGEQVKVGGCVPLGINARQ